MMLVSPFVHSSIFLQTAFIDANKKRTEFVEEINTYPVHNLKVCLHVHFVNEKGSMDTFSHSTYLSYKHPESAGDVVK